LHLSVAKRFVEMEIAQVLAAYDAEVRTRPPIPTGLTLEDEGPFVLITGVFNFVSAWRLTNANAGEAVAALTARFRAQGQPLIWRVYGHDEPSDLPAHLAAHGYVARPPGAFMVFDLRNASTAELEGIDVRRASTPADVSDFLFAADQAFETNEAAALQRTYSARLGDPHFAMFTAYAGGAPIASARLEMAPPQFGLLFGGGVLEAHRRRGVYRLLVQARAEEARRQGARHLATEARDTSRPALARMGFIVAAREVTWILPAAD
jgi:hypothetical protein